MMDHVQHVQVYHLEGGLEGVSRIVEHVESFLKTQGWHDTKIYQVALVLDELLTNTVSYGYPSSALTQTMDIQVELGITQSAVHITLKDNGIPFNPLSRPDPHLNADVEERPIGGLGIHLLHTFIEHISYKRQGNTNILTLESSRERKV